MHLQAKPLTPGLQWLARCAIGILFLLSLALRLSLYHVITNDYTFFLSNWYDFIQTHGGFAALKYNFSNYNPPYLYLLALAVYTPIPKLAAIKTISVIFDVVLALFTYLILGLRYKRSFAAIIGALVIVFAPTIFINSAAWGQCDAIYTAFCLGSLYFLLKERPAWACVFFALAISFKLQAIFFLPVLLIAALPTRADLSRLWNRFAGGRGHDKSVPAVENKTRRKLPLQYLVLIPLIFFLMLTPALMAGASLQSVLATYPGQVSTGGAGGGGPANAGGPGRFQGGPPGPSAGRGPGGFNGGKPGQFNGRRPGSNNGGRQGQFRGGGPGPNNGGGNFSSSSLTLNAPSFYQWLPANAPQYWKWVGILLAGAFVVLIGALLLASKQQLTPAILLKVTLVFALAIPFLLPEMHERYFYLADVVSIIYAFYFPRFFFIPIIQQLCSLFSYAPFLLHTQIVNLAYVACAILLITIITLSDLVLTLYPRNQKKKIVMNIN
jgi:Gpi18-like mannosyltransferase